jgi:hypothetical protein
MLGFHGCDESVRDSLVTNPDNVKKSQEVFDWLGHGFYVWENNRERAFQWAIDKKKRGTLIQPSVVGVIYQLDYCLDFTDTEFINVLSTYYDLMKQDLQTAGKELPKNKNKSDDIYKDLVLRELDCAVIEYLHRKIDEERKSGSNALRPFDTVRGIFTEGGPAYEGAGIQSKNHIQVCIRNLNCIKGFFIPRKEIKFP